MVAIPNMPTAAFIVSTPTGAQSQATPTLLDTPSTLLTVMTPGTTAVIDTSMVLESISTPDTTVTPTTTVFDTTSASGTSTSMTTSIGSATAGDQVPLPEPSVQSMSPWEVNNDSVGTTLICYALLLFFIGSLMALIGMDMYRKAQTGELRESINSMAALGRWMLGLPGRFIHFVLLKENWRTLKRKILRQKPQPVETQEEPVRNFATEAIIKRLSCTGPNWKSVKKDDVVVEVTPVAAPKPKPAEETKPAEPEVEKTGAEDGHESPASVYSDTYSVDASIIN